ncbi:hypothetical protein LTR17_027597 [Elasticomyces elasticus]|nr:hypothetical protein LTR17_027597 [Elasticomyces elasticus]
MYFFYGAVIYALLVVDDSYAATITGLQNYTNASTSTPAVRITTAANTTSSRIWSLWSTANYPAECNAYYTSAGADPYALPKWNATQNVAFFSSAYNCLSSLEAYETASIAWEDSHVGERVTTWLSVFQPRVLTDTYTITSYLLTTLCDGYPRVVTGLNASLSVGISKTSYTQFSKDEVITYSSTISGRTPPYTKPPPTCRLNCAACSMLTEAMENNLDDPLNAYGCPIIIPPDSYDCNVFVASAQMFYWPVSVQNGDLCNKTGTTVLATPTGIGPNTWVYSESITLTSPSVYITFHGLQYATWIFNETQSYSTNTLMAFQPDEIQSQQGYHGPGTKSFNYADLAPNLVPASAWFGQGQCGYDHEMCEPIGKWAYKPMLVFPSIFSQASPHQDIIRGHWLMTDPPGLDTR